MLKSAFRNNLKRRGFRYQSSKPPRKEYDFDPALHHETPANIQAKYENQQRVKAVILGSLALVGAIGAFEVYNNYAAVKSKVTGYQHLKSDEIDDEDARLKFELKRKQDIKQQLTITNPNSSEVPGLYVCGDNASGIVSEDRKVKFQSVFKRLGFFDNMLLRDVILGPESACAIDAKGNLYQWGTGFNGKASSPQVTYKGLNLVKCQITNGAIYALSKDGKVYYFPESSKAQENFEVDNGRTLGVFKSVKHYKVLDLEKINDISAGDEHLVALSKSGRVYTLATGFGEISKSNGQFGSTMLTQFDSPPKPNEPIEVSLLNRYKDEETNTFNNRVITQIASGKFHTLALDSLGYVWSFGNNVYGSLGKHVAYNTEVIPYPSKVELFASHFTRKEFPQCVNIAAGGYSSFATFVSSNIYKLFEDSLKGNKRADFANLSHAENNSQLHLAWGKGLRGELGINRFTHSQPEPANMKVLNGLKEYNEQSNKLEPTQIKSWSVGETHAMVTLSNGDVYAWGDNEYGQLGNGKRVRSAVPLNVPSLIEPDERMTAKKLESVNNRLSLKKLKKCEQVVTAGVNASALFYRPV